MKLNFFARIYLAITDFRLYPFVAQKEKFITSLAYFLGFIILISAVLATNTTTKVINWTNEFIDSYNAEVSEFVIENGAFKVSGENMDFDFMGVKILTDDQKGQEDFDFEALDVEDYDFTILGLKDTLAIGNSSGFILSQYTENFNSSKNDVYGVLSEFVKNPLAKIAFAFAIFCGLTIAYFISKFFSVLGISIILLVLAHLFRIKCRFKDYMKIAFYVITLPIIIEAIALIVTGNINEYAYITYHLLTYVYMYYAIRAVKLDNIIMTTHEKIMKSKEDIFKDKEEREINDSASEDKKDVEAKDSSNDDKDDENSDEEK